MLKLVKRPVIIFWFIAVLVEGSAAACPISPRDTAADREAIAGLAQVAPVFPVRWEQLARTIALPHCTRSNHREVAVGRDATAPMPKATNYELRFIVSAEPELAPPESNPDQNRVIFAETPTLQPASSGHSTIVAIGGGEYAELWGVRCVPSAVRFGRNKVIIEEQGPE